MGSSKKRRSGSAGPTAYGEPPRKKAHLSPEHTKTSRVKHAILSLYYPEILTLRQYVLLKLPESSRIRRRKICALGTQSSSSAGAEISDVERCVGQLLDTTLVGLVEEIKSVLDSRWEEWTSFPRRGDESYVTLSDGLVGATFSQSEIVDFVIWLLFSRTKTPGSFPRHLLSDGFRRGAPSRPQGQTGGLAHNVPGVYSLYPNPHVERLKEAPWPQFLKLLGSCGDRIMMDLLLDCSVFLRLSSGQDNYQQISGLPLSDARPLHQGNDQVISNSGFERSPSDISFMRNRMLYARAALNAKGLVHFGFRHIHVLNRAPHQQLCDHESDGQDRVAAQNRINTTKVMMYMFPRQFGLHNAFTSTVNFAETSQKLKDYTLREEEISEKFGHPGQPKYKISIPKRLRGRVRDLVQKLQVLHHRCSYSKLLEHFCPIKTTTEGVKSSQSSRIQRQKTTNMSGGRGKAATHQSQPTAKAPETSHPSSLMGLATPAAHVSAFCQAVVSKMIPNDFWGTNSIQNHNKDILLKNIDRFIRLRRFESMSLHEVMQGMKITDIEWLAPDRLTAHKTSRTDIRKRAELFHEFMYYVFDSIVIPLLRSNFYVTESSAHKYRLCFFRHDVWRYVTEPAMAALKTKMFEEVNLDVARRILDSRRFGFSQLRLLPKETGVRPIMNLRRRTMMRNNKKLLGPSINSTLGPIHTMLQLEKSANPAKLGAAMFSVGDVYKRLKTFKSNRSSSSQPLYFAKVDVQSAFDTIPQSSILALLDSIPQQREYSISKYVEITNNTMDLAVNSNAVKSKPVRKWHSMATKSRNASALLQSPDFNKAAKKKNTVFIESVVKRQYETSGLLRLLASHIQQNLVKIGKKFHRQKEGIPQGSVLSSILSNYFYADLERRVLKFLDSDDCLLLRLIDDFLLITTDREKAASFVTTMHKGVPEYGVTVSLGKSLVNFDLTLDEEAVPKVLDGRGFPYCGTLIDCKTLDITKDRDRGGRDTAIYNSLTVEFTRFPGQTFQRKVLNAFKIQSHIMFFDTTLNSAHTMLGNIFSAFAETASKMWAYARCLPRGKQPAAGMINKTIAKLVDLAYLLLVSKARKLNYPGYQCDVKKPEVAWLAFTAFQKVLRAKQSGYGDVLAWLEMEIGKLALTKEIRKGRVSSLHL